MYRTVKKFDGSVVLAAFADDSVHTGHGIASGLDWVEGEARRMQAAGVAVEIVEGQMRKPGGKGLICRALGVRRLVESSAVWGRRGKAGGK